MEKLTDREAGDLKRNKYAPADYAAWLERNGWGEVGQNRYMLYSGLIEISEIHEPSPTGFCRFGDDMSGYSGCFSENQDGFVHEWDSAAFEMTCTNMQFSEFIARYDSTN